MLGCRQKEVVLKGGQVRAGNTGCINDSIVMACWNKPVLNALVSHEVSDECRLVKGHEVSLDRHLIHDHGLKALENVALRVKACRGCQFQECSGSAPRARVDAAGGLSLPVVEMDLEALVFQEPVAISPCCPGAGNGNLQPFLLMQLAAATKVTGDKKRVTSQRPYSSLDFSATCKEVLG